MRHLYMILFSPLLACVCLVVLLCDLLFFNSQDRVEPKFTVSRLLSYIAAGFNFIATFVPNVLLGRSRYILYPLFTAVTFVTLGPIFLLLWLLREYLWDTLFNDVVPQFYFWYNSRVYRSAKVEGRKIRIIEIAPDTSTAGLKVKFIPVDLGTTDYVALSYCWGSHLMLRRIITANDHLFFVTDSLACVLRELRHPTEYRRVWIDGISINQRDHVEKGVQIGLMKDIYGRAEKVIIWLGRAPVQLGPAIEIIRDLGAAQGPQIGQYSVRPDDWQRPVQELLNRSWWSRVWTIQEVALSREAVVRSGSFEIPWNDLSAFLQRNKDIEDLHVSPKVLSFVQDIDQLKAAQAVRTDPPNGLLDLAIRFRHRSATKARDKLFGFCGLLQSPTSEISELDYGKPELELFAKFTLQCVTRLKSLSVLALTECSHREYYCSWVIEWPTFTSREYQKDPWNFEADSTREIFQTLWSGGLLPSVITQKYRAAGDSIAVCSPGTSGPEAWSVITLEGWKADTIAKVGEEWDASDWYHILHEWTKLAGDLADDKGRAFMRTLIANSHCKRLQQSPSYRQCYQR